MLYKRSRYRYYHTTSDMRILYINHYAGSPRHGMEYRPYYLAREWVRSGHQVQIIAADHSHLRRHAPYLGNSDCLAEVIDGIQYKWLRTPSYSGNGFGRVRNMSAFIQRLYVESGDIARKFRPEIVIASSTYPLDIWPARRIAQLSSAKLIFEVHDLWPLTPIELGGKSQWHPFIIALQAAEKYAYRHADVVVSVLPKIDDYLKDKNYFVGNLKIIPNGIDPAEWESKFPAKAEQAESVIGSVHRSGRSVVGYAGSHGVSNALENLLHVAKIMRHDRVVFVLVGDGPEKEELREKSRNESLENIVFLDTVPKYQVPGLLSCFDIAYIGWRRHSLYRFGISPNKLTDYMMAARPILHAVVAGNDLVSEVGCGITVPSENPAAAVHGLRRLLSEDSDSLDQMGSRGREFALKNLTFPVLAARFLDGAI